MEDKKLNEKESLELISCMIQNTRRKLELGDGNSMLLWGVYHGGSNHIGLCPVVAYR